MPNSFWPITLPHDASLHGHHVDAVLSYLMGTTGAAFGAMAGVLLVAVLFHRGRAREASYTHGTRAHDRLVTVAAGAVVLFGIDAVAVVRTSERLRTGFWRYPDADPKAVRVEVTAQQWAWSFRYPGADGRFATGDDIVTLNELRVPIHRPIYLQLTSKDVVHSFYLPNFRNKIDVIPGAVTRMWFQPEATGLYEIACAQHCGAWHYKMRGELLVMEAGPFAAWSARAAADTALRFAATTGAATTTGAPNASVGVATTTGAPSASVGAATTTGAPSASVGAAEPSNGISRSGSVTAPAMQVPTAGAPSDGWPWTAAP